jgi:hypothetical protein
VAGVDTVAMALRVLDHHGLDYEVRRNKHVKITVAYGDRRQTLVCGGSTSDKRALLNFYATIRKLLIGIGVPFEDCKALIHN